MKHFARIAALVSAAATVASASGVIAAATRAPNVPAEVWRRIASHALDPSPALLPLTSESARAIEIEVDAFVPDLVAALTAGSVTEAQAVFDRKARVTRGMARNVRFTLTDRLTQTQEVTLKHLMDVVSEDMAKSLTLRFDALARLRVPATHSLPVGMSWDKWAFVVFNQDQNTDLARALPLWWAIADGLSPRSARVVIQILIGEFAAATNEGEAKKVATKVRCYAKVQNIVSIYDNDADRNGMKVPFGEARSEFAPVRPTTHMWNQVNARPNDLKIVHGYVIDFIKDTGLAITTEEFSEILRDHGGAQGYYKAANARLIKLAAEPTQRVRMRGSDFAKYAIAALELHGNQKGRAVAAALKTNPNAQVAALQQTTTTDQDHWYAALAAWIGRNIHDNTEMSSAQATEVMTVLRNALFGV